MGFAVEAYFDVATEQRVAALWARLAESGVTSLLPDMGARPHVSLSTFDELDAERLRAALAAFAAESAPVRISLASVGSFPGPEGVVFLAPVVSASLLEWHGRFHEVLRRLEIEGSPLYRPEAWVPHCTIAMELDGPEVAEALRLTLEADAFGGATLTEVGLVSYRPVRPLARHPLGG